MHTTPRSTKISPALFITLAMLGAATACSGEDDPSAVSTVDADLRGHRRWCMRQDAGSAGDGAVVGADASTDASASTNVTDAGPTIEAGGPPVPTTQYDLYVAPNGSDSNAGTQAAPFRTILKASQVAMPDTTVHVAPGTYVGGFTTRANGTASARIYYRSDVRWGAKLVPPSSSSSAGGWENKGAYVTIDGFEVDGSNDPTSGTLWTVGIDVEATGDVIANCHVHHIFNSGTASGQGGAGILLDSWYGFNDMQALGNVVHHNGPATGGGSWYHGIYQTATGVIQNNVVYANAGGGIHLWHDANHIDVTNNTSFGNGIGFIVGGGDYVHTSGPADYIRVTNNIAFDNTAMGFDEEGQCGSHNLFANNLSFHNGTNWRLEFSPHTNDVTADPQFVDYVRGGGGDYHLRAASPAIDKGSSAYAPPFDYDGVARPYGAAVDLGAFEWHP